MSRSVSQQTLNVPPVGTPGDFESADGSNIWRNGDLTELGFPELSFKLASAIGEKRSLVHHKPRFFKRSPPKVIADNAFTRFTVSNASCNYVPEETCGFEQAIDSYCPGVRETIATGGAPSMPAAEPTLDEQIELCARLLLKGHEHKYHSQAATQQQTEEKVCDKLEGSASHRGSGQ